MKKYLAFILVFLLFASQAWASTPWFACAASATINAASEWSSTPNASSCGCTAGAYLIWGNQAAGDSFYANGCTGIAVNADPSPNSSVTLRTDLGTGGVVGGTFTFADATTIAGTYKTNILAGSTVCLATSGSNASPSNWIGVVTGSATTNNAYGIASTTTAGNIPVGTCQGGAGSTTGDGCHQTSGAGGFAVGSGGCVAGASGSAAGIGCSNASSSSIWTVTGPCQGSDSSAIAPGATANSGFIYCNGDLVWGLKGPPITGQAYWRPGAQTNKIVMPYDSSYTDGTVNTHSTEAAAITGGGSGTITNNANVKSGVTYGDQTGSLSGGSANAQ